MSIELELATDGAYIPVGSLDMDWLREPVTGRLIGFRCIFNGKTYQQDLITEYVAGEWRITRSLKWYPV